MITATDQPPNRRPELKDDVMTLQTMAPAPATRTCMQARTRVCARARTHARAYARTHAHTHKQCMQEQPRTAELEELLPLLAYGSLSSEDPSTLTQRHLGQLIGLGQSALDYLVALVTQTGAALVRLPGSMPGGAGCWDRHASAKVAVGPESCSSGASAGHRQSCYQLWD